MDKVEKTIGFIFKELMNQQRIISVSLEEWEQLQEELRKLKQQNVFMRKQLHGVMSPLLVKHRISVGSNDSNNQSPSKNENSEGKDREKFQRQMQEWSKKMSKKVPSKESRSNKKSNRYFQRDLRFSLCPVNMNNKQEQQEEENQIQNELNTSQGKVSEKSNEEDEEEEGDREADEDEEVNIDIKSQKEIQQFEVKEEKKQTQEQTERDKIEQQDEKYKLIECLCLYGPNWNQVEEKKAQKRVHVNNSLHYISKKSLRKHYQVYGEYFYPEGMVACRRIREEENLTQVNQIIFRKNTKKQDCSLYMFQADQNNKILKINNDMMNQVNPSKWLVAFCVQFSDYHLVEIEEEYDQNRKKLLNRSFSAAEQYEQQKKEGKKSDRLTLSVRNKKVYCVKSKYTLCIFTYFPFINIIEQLLISILDQVKIRRVEQYAMNSCKTQVTIHYFINQLQKIGKEVMQQIISIPPVISTDIHALILGHFKINFTFSRHSFDDLLYGGWVFDVIKMFDKDILYELFTNILMEESVCFVCQNLHVLTHVIFLILTILPQPFSYPYPCVSQMFNYQLLDSPFVVTIGINQSTKWLQENGSLYQKKIFVDLNEEKKIRGKRKPRNIKSQKLKKIFTTLYKKIESSSPIPNFLKKRGNIIKPASKEQNDYCSSFLRSLKNYLQQQIIVHLPNPAIITHIRQSIKDDNETAKVFGLIKEVEKYLKQSRKQKEKDQFVDLFVQQQTFYVYVSQLYNLN